MNKLRLPAVLLALVGIAALSVFFSFRPDVLRAAISVFSPATCYTASATSTLSFMTFGTGTTTVSCNMGSEGAKQAAIAFQLTASSTGTNLRFTVDESMDGQDWYPVQSLGQELATTSANYALAPKAYWEIQYSSTTPVGVNQFASQATSSGVFSVPVRMKYIRANAYLASTSGHLTNKNGAVWFQILPRVDTN